MLEWLDSPDAQRAKAAIAWLRRSRTARYLLLGPTALSILAQFEDLGRFAGWLVEMWRPIVRGLAQALYDIAPIKGDAALIVILVLLYSPFSISGLHRMLVKNQPTDHPITAVIGISAWYLLTLSLSTADPSLATFGGWFLIGAVLVCLLTPLTWLYNRRWRYPSLLAYPIFCALLMWMASHFDTEGFSPWLILVGVMAFLSPMLNLPRLRDAFVIVASLVVLSVAYDWAAKLLPS